MNMITTNLYKSNNIFIKGMNRPSFNFILKRNFKTGKPSYLTENKQAVGINGIIEADNSKYTTMIHHATNWGMFTIVPLAFITSPSILSMPLNYTLAFLIPIHSHIGMNGILSDYIPSQYRMPIRSLWFGVSLVMFLGLIRINYEGDGIIETIKCVWKEPKKKEIK